MKHVLSSEVFNEKDIEKLIRGTAKKKTDLILESIRDNHIGSDRRFKMNEVSNHLECLEKSILKTEIELYTRIYWEQGFAEHTQPFQHLAMKLYNLS